MTVQKLYLPFREKILIFNYTLGILFLRSAKTIHTSVETFCYIKFKNFENQVISFTFQWFEIEQFKGLK